MEFSDVPSAYLLAGAVSIVLAILWTRTQTFQLRHIPTVGTTVPILSYIDGSKFYHDSARRLQDGYEKYATGKGVFKVSMHDQWLVVIANSTLMEELVKQPADVADLRGGIRELIGAHEDLWAADPLHVHVLYNKLGNSLSDAIPQIKDEIWHSFDTDIGSPADWKIVPALVVMTEIFMKTINRMFVGLPLCRDSTFMLLVNKYMVRNGRTMPLVKKFPRFLKPLITSMVLSGPELLQSIHEYLAPVIRRRREQLEKHKQAGTLWHDKPNDMIMWLLEEVIAKGYSDEVVTFFLMAAEEAAIFNTAGTFVQALFYLAADPSLASALREEVVTALAAENGEWTKATVGRLVRMDSFLRESQRVHGVHTATLWRFTRKPFTFSNGVTLPANTFVSAAAAAHHTDEKTYKNANTFDPWRFVDTAKSLVTTGVDFIAFGHGRYACPGRYLAAYEIKLMLACIVTTYDVALPPEWAGRRPPDAHMLVMRHPDPAVNIMFKRRTGIS